MRNKLILALVVLTASAQLASAQVSVVVPGTFDPGSVGNTAFATVGPYMTYMVGFILITCITWGLVKFIRRKTSRGAGSGGA